MGEGVGGQEEKGKGSAGTWEWRRGQSLGTAGSCQSLDVGKAHTVRERRGTKRREGWDADGPPPDGDKAPPRLGGRTGPVSLQRGGAVSCTPYCLAKRVGRGRFHRSGLFNRVAALVPVHWLLHLQEKLLLPFSSSWPLQGRTHSSGKAKGRAEVFWGCRTEVLWGCRTLPPLLSGWLFDH